MFWSCRYCTPRAMSSGISMCKQIKDGIISSLPDINRNNPGESLRDLQRQPAQNKKKNLLGHHGKRTLTNSFHFHDVSVAMQFKDSSFLNGKTRFADSPSLRFAVNTHPKLPRLLVSWITPQKTREIIQRWTSLLTQTMATWTPYCFECLTLRTIFFPP